MTVVGVTMLSECESVCSVNQAQIVYQILTSVYEESPWSIAQIEADLAKDNTDYFFVYDKGKPVGFMALLHLIGESELTNIAVHGDYQGKGLARQLLSKLDDLSQPIFLEVRSSNTRAQMLYERSGFCILGTRKQYYHNPIEDALIMRREV